MLSQRHQLYLAIIVILIVGVFFFPDLYKDAKSEHHFCCSSFNGKITEIRSDEEDFKFVKLTDDKEYFLGKYLDKDDRIRIGDSIVKPSRTLMLTVYRNGKLHIGDDEAGDLICECD